MEGSCIQDYLSKSGKRHDKIALAKSFWNLMSHGRVSKALRLLSSNSSGGVLGLDDVIPNDSPPPTIREILVEKHPPGKSASTKLML